jgi:hypothetical protein
MPSDAEAPDSRREPPRLAARLVVDGEEFEVTQAGPDQYRYAWLSGPNPGYGFTSGIALALTREDAGRLVRDEKAEAAGALDRFTHPTLADMEAEVRAFLRDIDPETGFLR